MDWKTFDERHRATALLKELIGKTFTAFLAEHPDADVVAFGADCNAAYGEVFVSVLTAAGAPNAPEWQTSWDMIADWDFWDLNSGFDGNQRYTALKPQIEQLMYDATDEEMPDEETPEEGFLRAICTVMLRLRCEHSRLAKAALIVLDHDEATEESRARIEALNSDSV